MNDIFGLFLVVYLLYLAECVVLTRRNAVVFVAGAGGRWRIRQPWAPFAASDSALAFANPLPPLEAAFPAEIWPFHVSRDAFHAGPVHSLGPPAPRRTASPPTPLAATTRIAAESETLRINDRSAAKFASCAAARQAADLLRKLCAAPERDRPIVLAAAAAHALSESTVRARIDAFRRAARAVHSLSIAQFAYALVLAPAVGWYLGLASTWPWLLAGFGVLWLAIIVAYHAAHRRLYAEDPGERFTGLTLLLLTPLATIRARDLLGRRLLCAFHPLAVARALLDDAGYRDFAEVVLRDARHPVASASDACRRIPGAPGTHADRTWFARHFCEAIDRHLRRNGLDADSLLAAPAPEDATRVAFCPRCRIQFSAPGRCTGCGVELRPLPPSATHAPPSPGGA